VLQLLFFLALTPKIKIHLHFTLPNATGVSRIAVGAHWPEDVLVGASLGIIAG
jgi:membrane-associated phospholipid phosphatase